MLGVETLTCGYRTNTDFLSVGHKLRCHLDNHQALSLQQQTTDFPRAMASEITNTSYEEMCWVIIFGIDLADNITSQDQNSLQTTFQQIASSEAGGNLGKMPSNLTMTNHAHRLQIMQLLVNKKRQQPASGYHVDRESSLESSHWQPSFSLVLKTRDSFQQEAQSQSDYLSLSWS